MVGSALQALEGKEGGLWCEKPVDETDGRPSIPTSRRRSETVDKPFLMPIEDVFTISGRGTVVTGPGAAGPKVKVGEETWRLWGFTLKRKKTVVTGRGDVPEVVGRRAKRAITSGILLRGIKKDEVERGHGARQAGVDQAAYQV